MEGLVAIFIVLIVFGTVAAIVLGPIWFKERTKRSAHAIIAQAMERGQNLDPELMQRLTQSIEVQQNRPRKTLGNGIVLLALAGGFALASYFSGDFDPSGHAMGGMMTTAVILGALGAAFTLLAIIDYASKKKDG
ncbi:MAG: DUF6249 domain-containing protein [Hyphomonadaceae bacterium]